MGKTHMQYHWWKYVLVLVTAICAWSWVFHAIAQPAENECLSILLVGENFAVEALQTDIETVLPQLSQQTLSRIEVAKSNIQGDEAWRILQTRFYAYDLVIIEEEFLPDNMDAALGYHGMNADMLSRFQEEILYIRASENTAVVYGFELGQERLGAFYTGEGKCYCFPSPWSVNYAALNGRGREQDDCGLRVLEYLLKGRD